jgi:uracil-DNA glycosylase
MTSDRPIALEPGWLSLLQDEFRKDYMVNLRAFLLAEKQAGKVIFPPGPEIFNALNSTPFDNVRVVIFGQDPYHGPDQAHGLCFSVRRGVEMPPSLVNIFREIRDDLGIEPPGHGCLESWSRQGVLLLNAVLTVEQHKAGSHHARGWETFTDRVVELLNDKKENLVFLLWGNPARKKGAAIDRNRHLVLEAPHPSPLSVYRGFSGCRHFSQCNGYLKKHGLPEIDWSIKP